MKNKELQEILAKLPDDADIFLKLSESRQVLLDDTDIVPELDIGVILIEADY